MMKTFDDIWPMMQALWPHADLGDGPGLRNLYRERLSKCRPALLEQALKDVRTNYSSRTPELKWILERYRGLHREWESNISPVEQTSKEEEEKAYMDEVRQSRERIAFNLSLLTPDEIAKIRAELQKKPFLSSIVGKIHGPIEGWSYFSQGMAWALHSTLSSGQSPGPNQDQRLLG